MTFTQGETVYFDSRTAGGRVFGEFIRADADGKAAVRVTSSPDGGPYRIGQTFSVPVAKLAALALDDSPAPAVPVAVPVEPAAPRRVLPRGPLVDAYRPARLADVRGQSDAVATLTAFASSPYPAAFLLAGPTGTGKTSAARALAREIGVSVDDDEFGGLYEIASGEQTAEGVRDAVRKCFTRPMMGSGWKVLIVNEADCMSNVAGIIWLDVLERIPANTVIVFTTNDVGKIPQRLRDRCVSLDFAGTADELRPALQSLARDVWRDATGRTDCPPADSFGGWEDRDGYVSFRRLLQRMEPFVRTGRRPQTLKGCAA